MFKILEAENLDENVYIFKKELFKFTRAQRMMRNHLKPEAG